MNEWMNKWNNMILMIGFPQWKICQLMKMIANPPSPIIMKQSGSHYYIIFSNQRSHYKPQYCYMCPADTVFTAIFERYYDRLPIPTCLISPNVSFTYTLFFQIYYDLQSTAVYKASTQSISWKSTTGYIVMTTPKIIPFSTSSHQW